LNSLHPKIVCIEFDWIWPAGSGGSLIEFGLLFLEKISRNVQYIFTLSLLSPLGEGFLLPLNLKLESPSTKDDFCQVW
jgi:hypothetical protein